jgi:hypothetical protein
LFLERHSLLQLRHIQPKVAALEDTILAGKADIMGTAVRVSQLQWRSIVQLL